MLEWMRQVDRSVVMTVTVVVCGYRALPEPLAAITRIAKSAKLLRFSTPARLYLCDTLLEGLLQDLHEPAAALGPFIQEEQAVVGRRHLARPRHMAPADQPGVRDGMVRHAVRAAVTKAVRSTARPATRRMRVVSTASARVMAGRMVVSRRASTDVPAPGGPMRRTEWAERLHRLQLH
jgi:hypothetical protein